MILGDWSSDVCSSDLMSNTVQEIMAYQNRLIERMRDELSDRKSVV